MRLNGISAEPGTLIGMSKKEFRPMVVDEPRVEVDHNGDWHDVLYLRYATPEDLQPRYKEPRSVAEHYAIPQKMSPYGLIRQFKPSPRVPVKIELDIPSNGMSRQERRKIKRAIESGKINRIITTGNYR